MFGHINTLSNNDTPLEHVLSYISTCITAYYRYEACDLNPGKYLSGRGKTFKNVQNGLPKGVTQQCFHNAALNVINDPDNKTQYVEGIVFDSKFGPFYHGWNLVDGKPVDFTLNPGNYDLYCGVVIPPHLVTKAISNAQKTKESEHGVLGTSALYKYNKKVYLNWRRNIKSLRSLY